MLPMQENQKQERTMFSHKHFKGSEWKLGVFVQTGFESTLADLQLRNKEI
jgi:hypothetical protein